MDTTFKIVFNFLVELRSANVLIDTIQILLSIIMAFMETSFYASDQQLKNIRLIQDTSSSSRLILCVFVQVVLLSLEWRHIF
jgi:hypothetical protein